MWPERTNMAWSKTKTNPPLTHSLTYLPTHPPTHSLTHPHNLSPSHSLSHSLTHPPTHWNPLPLLLNQHWQVLANFSVWLPAKCLLGSRATTPLILTVWNPMQKYSTDQNSILLPQDLDSKTISRMVYWNDPNIYLWSRIICFIVIQLRTQIKTDAKRDAMCGVCTCVRHKNHGIDISYTNSISSSSESYYRYLSLLTVIIKTVIWLCYHFIV